jgi:hypothetical protein
MAPSGISLQKRRGIFIRFVHRARPCLVSSGLLRSISFLHTQRQTHIIWAQLYLADDSSKFGYKSDLGIKGRLAFGLLLL